MRLEAFFASFSPSFDPVAHRSLTDSQCSGDVFLLPTFLFQFPRSFPSFFSPIGFLWCSHASYCLILDFFLSRSVDLLWRVRFRWKLWPRQFTESRARKPPLDSSGGEAPFLSRMRSL